MIIKEKSYWVLSTNGENFDGEMYEAKEEAIANIDKELAPAPHQSVYVARCIPLDLEWAKKSAPHFRRIQHSGTVWRSGGRSRIRLDYFKKGC
jgi:hypothetical protein